MVIKAYFRLNLQLTANGMFTGANYRGYDYTFPLPLNALAWERVGFRSVFVIIGSRCQWENDPVLKLMLSYMEERKAVVIFMEADKDNWTMLSQNARIFTANLDSFPGLFQIDPILHLSSGQYERLSLL